MALLCGSGMNESRERSGDYTLPCAGIIRTGTKGLISPAARRPRQDP